MAALVVDATEVLSGTNADFFQGISGATVTAGQVCYLDAMDNKIKLADADASLARASVRGIALHGALSGQPLRLQTAGDLIFGVSAVIDALTVVVGESLVLSATPGGITQSSDLATGMYVTTVGITSGADRMRLNLFSSNQPVPA